jgi:hypothetical protein
MNASQKPLKTNGLASSPSQIMSSKNISRHFGRFESNGGGTNVDWGTTMKAITILIIAVTTLFTVGCGDDDGTSTPSLCEALADQMEVCDPAPDELAAEARMGYLEQCENGLANGEPPYGRLNDGCRSLAKAIAICRARTGYCGDIDETSPCATERVNFTNECGR